MITNILIILNIFILEALLSVDNAAVLAVMVNDLPQKDRRKALTWGLWGAYLMRGLSLLCVSWLLSFQWLFILKVGGGVFLIRLWYDFIKGDENNDGAQNVKDTGVYRFLTKHIGLPQIWAVIVAIEFADMAFSVDNIFAAVAMTTNYWLIIAGVFVGILAMRFVAQKFNSLINSYPSLKGSAFIVVGLLGLKLVISGVVDGISVLFNKLVDFRILLQNHYTDLAFSAIMMIIFFIPLLKKNKQVNIVP